MCLFRIAPRERGVGDAFRADPRYAQSRAESWAVLYSRFAAKVRQAPQERREQSL